MPRKSFGRIFSSDAVQNGEFVLNRVFGQIAPAAPVYDHDLDVLREQGYTDEAIAEMTKGVEVERYVSVVGRSLTKDLTPEEYRQYLRQIMRIDSERDNTTGHYIPVADIINLLEKSGYRESDVLSAYPMLEESDITACRAFAAVNMPESKDFKRNNRYRGVKILLDENLYHGFILQLSQHISNISHIYYEGMGGFMDDFIYWRPHHLLKEESPKEHKRKKSLKHIIISNDSDLCDLAEDQWRGRIKAASDPDAIDFKDTNTVFNISKVHYSKLKDPEFCEKVSRGIMRAAFDPKAPWYKIRGNGTVYPGVLFPSLCNQVETTLRNERFKNGVATEEDAIEGRLLRIQRRQESAAARGGYMPRKLSLDDEDTLQLSAPS